MTCRMLIAIGNFQAENVFRDFKLMAMNKNEKHENNRNNSDFLHNDGWGVVLGKSGRLTEVYKKDVACWKDPRFRRYYKANVDYVIAHARRATDKNFVDLSYTHPFEKEGWYFCHNGTLVKPPAKDKRDSELLFKLLLSNIENRSTAKEGIKNAVERIKDFTALNFILANSDFGYVLIKYKKKPLYYSMKYLKKKDYIIVSSEILPHFKGRWKTIDNDTLLELNISNRSLNVLNL